MKYTQEETDIIVAKYGNISKEELLSLLPNRNWNNIKQKASKMGLTRKRIPWTDKENKILTEMWNKYDAKTIAKALPGRTNTAIYEQVRVLELGKKISYDYWTDEEIEDLKIFYPTMTKDELTEYFQRPYSSIEHKGLRLKLRRGEDTFSKERLNKYNVNEEFFDNVDTPNKAYILGLWFADGWNTSKDNRIGISLKAGDGYLLESIKNTMSYTGNIVYRKDRNMATLRISSEKLTKKLTKVGCVPKKSNIMEFPIFINKKLLISHFVRGYFDGDGSISYSFKNEKPYGRVSFISGSYVFLKDLYYILTETYGMNTVKIAKKKEDNAFAITWGSIDDVTFFYNWFYNTKPKLYLKRKKEKFEEYLKMKNIL